MIEMSDADVRFDFIYVDDAVQVCVHVNALS
jgi:nucleoside-diphosphate-sugar epimerase